MENLKEIQKLFINKDITAEQAICKVFDIYLIDLILPQMTGKEVMQRIRKDNPSAIIILISSINNYKTISEILDLGADDYLIKPFDRSIFIAKIKSHLRTYLLRIDLEEKNKLLEKMAYTDGLTKLCNHRFIMEKLFSEKKDQKDMVLIYQ